MNVHAARNPTGWYGHTPYYGVIINAHDAHYPRVVAWLSMVDYTATHRGYTFDSPGLPTIGGYPGEQGGGNATPLGVVLSFYLRSPCNKNPPRGCEGEGIITDNGGYDGEQWRV